MKYFIVQLNRMLIVCTGMHNYAGNFWNYHNYQQIKREPTKDEAKLLYDLASSNAGICATEGKIIKEIIIE